MPEKAALFINKGVDTSDLYPVIWPFAILNVSFPGFLLHYQVITFLAQICALPHYIVEILVLFSKPMSVQSAEQFSSCDH